MSTTALLRFAEILRGREPAANEDGDAECADVRGQHSQVRLRPEPDIHQVSRQRHAAAVGHRHRGRLVGRGRQVQDDRRRLRRVDALHLRLRRQRRHHSNDVVVTTATTTPSP